MGNIRDQTNGWTSG